MRKFAGTIISAEWTHVAATYDGSQMRIYKDGVEVAGVAKTGGICTDNMDALELLKSKGSLITRLLLFNLVVPQNPQ